MVEAFELFNNTYVKTRQDIYEKIFNYLLETGERLQLMTVEPITERLSEQALLQIMTTDELREKAGLKPLNQGGNEQFKSDIDNLILEELSKVGRSAENMEFLASRPLKYGEDEEPVFNEDEFRMSFALEGELTDLERQILGMLKDNPKLSATELADATGTDLETVDRALDRLADGS